MLNGGYSGILYVRLISTLLSPGLKIFLCLEKEIRIQLRFFLLLLPKRPGRGTLCFRSLHFLQKLSEIQPNRPFENDVGLVQFAAKDSHSEKKCQVVLA